MQSDSSSFVSMDEDGDSLVLSSPESYPRDMLVHQRSVSQDWTGRPFPCPLLPPQVSPHHDIAENPQPLAEATTRGATGLRRGYQSSPHMEARSQYRRGDTSLPPDGSSGSSECGSVATAASSTGSAPESATVLAQGPDVRQKQHHQPTTVTYHEIQTNTNVEHMDNVSQHYQSRVGTGLSAEMSKLAIQQQQQQQQHHKEPIDTSIASVQDKRQSSRTSSKDATSSQGSRPRTSRSKSRSRTPSQAFPILAGLSECNRQHSPKLSRANLDTGASGYDASWQRAGKDHSRDNAVENPMGQ